MIKSIQSLRAFAAMSVVLFHIGAKIAAIYPGSFTNPFSMGNSGVDLFFIISGFVMLYTIESGSYQNAWHFLKNRFIRIIPLYWFTTTIFVILLLSVPGIFQSYNFDLVHSICSYLFIPQSKPPVVSIGWTLVYIMFFSMVLSVCIAAGFTSRIVWVTFLFMISYLVGLSLPELKVSPVFDLVTSELLLEFCIGMLLFIFFERGVRVGLLPAVCFIALGLAAFHLLAGTPRLYSYGMPMALITGGVLLSRRELLNIKALHFIGDSSYSLFLVQVFTVPACGVLTRKLAPDITVYLIPMIIIYMAVTFVSAISLYFVVEKPVTVILRKRFQ